MVFPCDLDPVHPGWIQGVCSRTSILLEGIKERFLKLLVAQAEGLTISSVSAKINRDQLPSDDREPSI